MPVRNRWAVETGASYVGPRGVVALVTGGCRGIGLVIAERLHGMGAHVIATSRDLEKARLAAQRFGTPPCVLDVRDAGSVAGAIAKVVGAVGQIRVLVNNAGVNAPAPFLKADVEDWDRIVGTNARGAFLVSQAVARGLTASGLGGCIVSIGSQAGLVAIEERAAYCASKSALIGLTRVMAVELAAADITANCVAPTFVATDMTADALSRQDVQKLIMSRIPRGRLATGGDVASAVEYLVGPGARMVTGQTIAVDGGWTAL